MRCSAPRCSFLRRAATETPSPKLTLSNYNQITDGMTKAQVERIMGPPTTIETKDMLVFKKTIYRYEDGSKFALFTFKNDELDSKEGNLAAQ